jgi:hypothetical protein
MLKDTEKEIIAEQTLPPDPPRKKWTCKCKPIAISGALMWSYNPDVWCEPIEYKDE